MLSNPTQNPKLDHKIEQLLDKFKTKFCNETELISIMEKYVSSKPDIEPLKSFFDNNKLSPNEFYQALRYPYNKEWCEYRHIDLKYRGTDGIQLDCKNNCRLTDTFQRKSEMAPYTFLCCLRIS